MSRLAQVAGRILAPTPRRPRHKLHAVRFRRLAGSVRALAALCDDAAEKLEGEWILDRSYAAVLAQRTLDLGRSIVFDSRVLCGGDSGRLRARLEAVRGRVEERLAGGRRAAGAPGDATPHGRDREEPELGLLRDVLACVSLGGQGELSEPVAGRGADGLAPVVAEAHEDALRSFEGLRHETWGRQAGRPVGGSGFPGTLRLVDTGGGISAPSAGGWAARLDRAHIRCAPLEALLGPGGGAGPVEGPSPGPPPSALALVSEECLTLDLRWPGGSVVLDACLGDDAEANVVYLALRGGPPRVGGGLGDVVASEGLRVVPLGSGVTAWLAGRGRGDTGRVLGRVGEALRHLVGESAARTPGIDGRGRHPEPVEGFNGRGRA